MSTATLTVRRLTRTIGAVAGGVDLAGGVDGATVALLQGLVDEHQVVFLRGQHLDASNLGPVAARFGELAVHPVGQVTGRGRAVSTIADSAAAPPAGFTWHTDLSWTATPPALGFLSALEIPAFGGDTLWASGRALYERLDADTARRCHGLGVVHEPESTLLASIERHHGAAVRREVEAQHPPVVQPLVRTHPRTGQPVLWLSPLYTRRVAGLAEDEGEALLRRLDAMIEDPEVQVRWRWAPGDLAIWDEAATCHRALTDHFPQPRRMVRCTTVGAAPVGPGR